MLPSTPPPPTLVVPTTDSAFITIGERELSACRGFASLLERERAFRLSGLYFNDFDNSIIFSSLEQISREFVAALLQSEEDQKMMSISLGNLLT
jgi:hypothetical protein